jgi:hypothetical protein
MTNWYRKPSPISVAKLLFRKGQNLFLDHSLHPSLMKHLPPGSAFPPKPDAGETRERSIRLCQEKHAILITADLGYTPALDSDAGGAWGVILLPDDFESQAHVLSRLAAEKLTFRPTKETTDIIEFAGQTAFCLIFAMSRPF